MILVHYYASPLVTWDVKLTVYFAWVFGMATVLLLPYDLSLALTNDDSSSESKSSTEENLSTLWVVIYWFTFILAWLVFPIQMEYHTNGNFHFLSKLVNSLKNLFYQIVLCVFLFLLFLLYMLVINKKSMEQINTILIILSNTYGIVLITVLLGNGLISLPLKVLSSSYNNPYSISQASKNESSSNIDETDNFLLRFCQSINQKKSKKQLNYLTKLYCLGYLYENKYQEAKYLLEEVENDILIGIQELESSPIGSPIRLNSEKYLYILYDKLNGFQYDRKRKSLTAPSSSSGTTGTGSGNSSASNPSSSSSTTTSFFKFSFSPFSSSSASSTSTTINPIVSNASSSSSSAIPPSYYLNRKKIDYIEKKNLISLHSRLIDAQLNYRGNEAKWRNLIKECQSLLENYNKKIYFTDIYWFTRPIIPEDYYSDYEEGLEIEKEKSLLFKDKMLIFLYNIKYYIHYINLKYFYYNFLYIIAILLFILSFLILISEFFIILDIKSPLLYIIIMETGVSKANITNFYTVYIQISSFCLLFYMCLCVFYSILRINLVMNYVVEGPHLSLPSSLLFNSQYLGRLQFILGYNFLLCLNYSKVDKEVQFNNIMSEVETIPLFGKSFILYSPILMILISILTYFNVVARILKFFNIENEDSILVHGKWYDSLSWMWSSGNNGGSAGTTGSKNLKHAGFIKATAVRQSSMSDDEDMDEEIAERYKQGKILITNEIKLLKLKSTNLKKKKTFLSSTQPLVYPSSSSTAVSGSSSSSSTSGDDSPSMVHQTTFLNKISGKNKYTTLSYLNKTLEENNYRNTGEQKPSNSLYDDDEEIQFSNQRNKNRSNDVEKNSIFSTYLVSNNEKKSSIFGGNKKSFHSNFESTTPNLETCDSSSNFLNYFSSSSSSTTNTSSTSSNKKDKKKKTEKPADNYTQADIFSVPTSEFRGRYYDDL